MKALLATAGLLVLLLASIPAAQAQQSAALTMLLSMPEDPLLREDEILVYTGTVMFTADITAYTSLNGIPVSYTVTKQPEWATVIVSPATDIFPMPMTPFSGASVVISRAITVTIALAHEMDDDAIGDIEVTAVTSPSVLGKSATGKATAPVSYDAPEPPCPEPLGLTPTQVSLAIDAVDSYNEYQAAKPEEESDEVSTQSATASPISLPWVAVAGFALVGAGVGLALRRNLAR